MFIIKLLAKMIMFPVFLMVCFIRTWVGVLSKIGCVILGLFYIIMLAIIIMYVRECHVKLLEKFRMFFSKYSDRLKKQALFFQIRQSRQRVILIAIIPNIAVTEKVFLKKKQIYC